MSSPVEEHEMPPLDPLLEQSFPIEDEAGPSGLQNSERRQSIQTVTSNASDNTRSDKDVDPNAAPSYPVHKRLIGAVEVPMIVMNLERAQMAFGNISTFKNVSLAP